MKTTNGFSTDVLKYFNLRNISNFDYFWMGVSHTNRVEYKTYILNVLVVENLVQNRELVSVQIYCANTHIIYAK